jgi:hypothetical protein
MREETPAVYAYYFIKTAVLYPIVLICDDDDSLIGIFCKEDIGKLHWEQGFALDTKTMGEVCNRKFSVIRLPFDSDSENEEFIYREARNIFAEKNINTLPVVDQKNHPQRLFGRFQAFFSEKWSKLPKASYAHCIWEATRLAESRGYTSISVIEFGVAAGRGLVLLELYAKEISRLIEGGGIDIEVYGFDSGTGLPTPTDYRDVTQLWCAGDYKMDFERLRSRLRIAKLIMGDIRETAKTFFKEYNPAPIGAMLIDVDQYTPSVAILDMLLEDDKHFLPIVQMYFDDIFESLEFQGENLAIKEFNAKSKHCKISPEFRSESGLLAPELRYMLRIKQCVRFTHEKLARPRDFCADHLGLII